MVDRFYISLIVPDVFDMRHILVIPMPKSDKKLMSIWRDLVTISDVIMTRI